MRRFGKQRGESGLEIQRPYNTDQRVIGPARKKGKNWLSIYLRVHGPISIVANEINYSADTRSRATRTTKHAARSPIREIYCNLHARNSPPPFLSRLSETVNCNLRHINARLRAAIHNYSAFTSRWNSYRLTYVPRKTCLIVPPRISTSIFYSGPVIQSSTFNSARYETASLARVSDE